MGAAKLLALSAKGDVQNLGGELRAGDLGLAIGGNFLHSALAAKRQQQGRAPIDWLETTERSHAWRHRQAGLTPEAATVVQAAAALGTAWAGGFGVFAAEGAAAATVGSTVLQAGTMGLASQGAVASINHGFDPGKVAKELTSKNNLQALATGMATAGHTAAALRKEIITGNRTKGRYHLQKVEDYTRALSD